MRTSREDLTDDRAEFEDLELALHAPSAGTIRWVGAVGFRPLVSKGRQVEKGTRLGLLTLDLSDFSGPPMEVVSPVDGTVVARPHKEIWSIDEETELARIRPEGDLLPAEGELGEDAFRDVIERALRKHDDAEARWRSKKHEFSIGSTTLAILTGVLLLAGGWKPFLLVALLTLPGGSILWWEYRKAKDQVAGYPGHEAVQEACRNAVTLRSGVRGAH